VPFKSTILEDHERNYNIDWEMGEQVASQILDLEPGNAAVKPLAAGGKWDLKANVELLRKEEPGVNIQSGLYLKEVNTVEIC
jgi:hypothetical protein